MTQLIPPDLSQKDAPSLQKDIHPLQVDDFRAFWIGRVCSVLASSAQSAAIAWQVYEIARRHSSVAESALYVGLIGLAQFLAQFVLTIPAGILVDSFERKKIVSLVYVGQVLASLAFLAYAFLPEQPFWGLFLLSGLIGALRAFAGPASSAMAPMLVDKALLPKAIAVNGIAFQTGLIVGPALGGILVGLSPKLAYLVCAVLMIMSLASIMVIKSDTKPVKPTTTKMEMLKEGMVYVWQSKVIFGALSLDLVAVLLGGVTALLPIFAKDVLYVGPQAYGILRASPAIGALMTSFALSRWPIRYKAGKWMFFSVAIFGICTIIFGLSKVFWISVAAMVVLGAADMISVFVRGTLVQIVTPDHMRGRVSAVSLLFIGASNELGEFESGVAARFLGPVGAALFGGIGSLIATGMWIKMFPQLYKADKLE